MQFIGTGVYSIAEVARYAGTNPQKLYKWFRLGQGAVLDSDYASSEIPSAVSFLDLIDALVVAQMRDMEISMQHIRAVRDVFSQEWDTPHPFCTKRFFVDVSEKRIIQQIDDDKGNRLLVDALKKQSQFEVVLRPTLRAIDYGEDSKIAELWRIATGVTISPEVMLGKPVLSGTRIPTSVIASQYYAYDKDAKAVASLYEIRAKAVTDAVKFEREKGTIKRAA